MEAGGHVAALRNALTRLEAIRSEQGDVNARMTLLRAEAEKEAGRPVRYDRYVAGWIFWPGAFVLALVEFFANFPVFRLMLPMSSALSKVAQTITDNVDDTSIWAGPKLLGHEMLMHVEATIVALVAVVILVSLGKTLGGSARPLMAFTPKDYPLAAQTIRSHGRQQWALVAASVIGIACVLSFLFVSRSRIAGMAASRVAADSARIEKRQRDISEATASGNRARAAQLTIQLIDAQDAHRQLEDDAAYAHTVEQNNLPILGLNLGLIFTAMVLGFSYKSEDLSDKRGEHPEIVVARERLSHLDREMYDVLQRGRDAEGRAHGGISRVEHLLRANPLREWPAKLDRLQGVIPLFRGENARTRGLDPANIRAFDQPAELDMPSVNDLEPSLEPANFARLRKEFAELNGAFAQLAPRMTPAFGHRAIA